MADFELMIDPGGLQDASSQYTKAAGQFSEAVTVLQSKLSSALNIWQDSAEEQWTERVKKACDDLDGIRELLEGNAKSLAEMAEFANNSETAVNQGISSL